MLRQRILHGTAPARLWASSTKRRCAAPPAARPVMRGQLRAPDRICSRPHVTLGVLPFGMGAHRSTAARSLRGTPAARPRVPDVAYAEYLAGGGCSASARAAGLLPAYLNQLSLEASSAGPAASILTRILAET